MKKDKSTIIIIAVLALIAVVGYFVLGSGLENEDKFKNLIVSTTSGQKIQTEFSSILNKDFFIKVPTQFTEMSDEDKQKEYLEIPDKVYISSDNLVRVVMDITSSQMANGDIKEYKDNFTKTLNENTEVLNSEMMEIDKHNVAAITYQDDKNYYYTLYFSYQNNLSFVSFVCSLDAINDWKPVGDFIMDSLYFK